MLDGLLKKEGYLLTGRVMTRTSISGLTQRRRKLHEAAGAETAQWATQVQRHSQYKRSQEVGGAAQGNILMTTPFKFR